MALITKGAIVGIEAVTNTIKNANYTQWQIHNTKPVPGKDPDIVRICNKRNKEEAIEAFKSWAEDYLKYSDNPSKQFYIEILPLGSAKKPKHHKILPEVVLFRLAPIDENEQEEPKSFSGIENRTEYEKILIENEKLKWEMDRLKAEMLEEDEDDDEDDDDDDAGIFGNINPESMLGQSIGKIINHFADSLVPAAGTHPVLTALKTLKESNPKSEQVLMKLAELVKTDPESVNIMIDQLYKNFFSPSNNES